MSINVLQESTRLRIPDPQNLNLFMINSQEYLRLNYVFVEERR